MIWRMATPFDTDYSFLNLPEAGSDVRGPIELPSFQPKDSSFNLEKYAPRQLQNQRLVQPSLAPLSDLDSQNVLSSARPFEDIQSLGATFGQRLAETERFFGDRVNKLQGSIEQLMGEKDKLGQDLEAAFLQQDEMSQQAIEEQIAALDAQRAELVAQLESSVAEAEANGVDAVAASEKVAAEQRQQFEGQLTDLDQQLQDLEVSKQEAIAAGNQQLVQELEAQQQQLTAQREQLVSQMEQQFGGERSELEGQITSLDERLSQLQIDKELAIEQGDQQRVAELETLEQQLTQERDQITSQMEEQFGGERSAFEGEISTLEDQLNKLQIDKELAIAQGDEQRVAELESQEQVLIQERDALVAQMEQQFGSERGNMEAKQAELEGQLQDIQAAQEQAIAERDQAIAEQDTIRAQAADEQVQALEGLKQQLLTERESIVGGLEGQIGDLQGEIDSLTGARDTAIGERDQAIAAQDTIRAEAADQQAQALDAQAGDYQAQLDQLTGQSTQYQGQVGERDQTITDLQSQIQALQATPATVATPAPSPITPPIDVKPIIDPNTGEEMTADRLQNLKPTIFGTPMLEGADFSNMPVYTPPTASSMPTFIPQSVSQAVGNVPAPGGRFNPDIQQVANGGGYTPTAPAQDPVIRMYDKEPLPPTQQLRPDKLRPPLTKPNLPTLIPITRPGPVPDPELSRLIPITRPGPVTRFPDLPRPVIKPIAKPTPSLLAPKPKFGLMAKAMEGGRTISDMDRQIGMMYGGEMKRYANGGEIENMLSGMDSGEQEAMGELEQMAPEMEMIDQLVNMVVQMIQQGASEEQVISFLREQGLDDEDIGTVLQLVAEMAETEEVAAQNEIGSDLEQLG
jgi:hypothetical protein